MIVIFINRIRNYIAIDECYLLYNNIYNKFGYYFNDFISHCSK